MSTYQGQRHYSGLVGTIIFHAAILVALLFGTTQLPLPHASNSVLKTFDVPPPPPPPPPEHPPKPPAKRLVKPDPGGTPRLGRPQPRPATTAPAEQPLATIVPIALPHLLPPTLPALAGLGAAPASGSASAGSGGTGGSGTGASEGPGNGATSDIYARAAWIRLPSRMDFDRVFPERAAKEQVEGTVEMTCEVARYGRPVNCRIRSEMPPAYGFGKAAIDLTPAMRVKPVNKNGKRTDMPVIITVGFDYAKDRR